MKIKPSLMAYECIFLQLQESRWREAGRGGAWWDTLGLDESAVSVGPVALTG